MSPPHLHIIEETLLDQRRRERLFNFIESDPGVNFSGLREYMAEKEPDGSVRQLSRGSLSYHLDRLEEFGLVRSAYRGRERLLYPVGYKIPGDYTRNAEDNRVLDILRGVPGVTQRRLAELADVAQSTMSYRLRRIADFIRVERVGRENILSVKEETVE